MNTYSQVILDWSRGNTPLSPSVRRGNLAVLATAEFRDGQMISTPINKRRYVWPNPYHQTQSNSLSRKLYAR